MKFNKIYIVTILCLCLMVGAVSADNNTTVLENETVLTEEEDYPIPYRYSEQYEQDVDRWYNYYIQSRTSGYESELYVELNNYLHSTTLSAKDQNDAILIKLGWDFRLDYYTNPEKCTIDENTGAVTYDLGIANWWAKLFGNGIKEETLPQTIAEGDALLKIYQENYNVWISVLKADKEEENR